MRSRTFSLTRVLSAIMGQLGGKQDADKSSSVVGGALVVITDAVVIVVVTAVVS